MPIPALAIQAPASQATCHRAGNDSRRRVLLLKLLPAIELTLGTWQYALDWHLKTTPKASLAATMRN
jgi:hypothetical protein